MIKEYSEEEMKAIYEKIKPSKEEEETSVIQKVETEVKEIQLRITKKSSIYPELNLLKNELINLKNRVETLENQVGVTEEEIELIKIPKKNAIKLIQSYIDKNQGCLTSDIILDLNLDPDLVLDVLKELEEKESVRGREIE